MSDLRSQYQRQAHDISLRTYARPQAIPAQREGTGVRVGGNRLRARSVSNEALGNGDPVVLSGDGGLTTQERRKVRRGVELGRPNPAGNYLKIFVWVEAGGFRRYWLVGVYSAPKLIVEIDLSQEEVREAKGESTGAKQKDWVFGIKTQKKGTRPQPYRLQTFYGSGGSYDSDFAQVYESQFYRGNGFWAGNLFLDDLEFLPVTISYTTEGSTAETVSEPLVWYTTTYSNAQPTIRDRVTGQTLSESAYRTLRDLEFLVDVDLRDQIFILYTWWGYDQFGRWTYNLRQPGDTGNQGAAESRRAYTKQYSPIGGSYYEGVFTLQRGSIAQEIDFTVRLVQNYTYYPDPEYDHFRQETTRRYKVYLGPNQPVDCTLDHVFTSDRDGLVPATIVNSGTEYQPILQKSFGDGGYYMQLASGPFTRLVSDSGSSAPVTFNIKPSATAPEIVLTNNTNLGVDQSWVPSDDEVKLYFCDFNQFPDDWLGTGTAPVKEFALSGGQYAETAQEIDATFKPASADAFGVAELSDLRILGAYYWPSD